MRLRFFYHMEWVGLDLIEVFTRCDCDAFLHVIRLHVHSVQLRLHFWDRFLSKTNKTQSDAIAPCEQFPRIALKTQTQSEKIAPCERALNNAVVVLSE